MNFISDLQQAIGLVLQSPVIEMVAGLVSGDQETTAEIVNAVRRGGDIAQLFISRINTTPGQISISQLPSIENKEGLIRTVHIFREVVQQYFTEPISAEPGLCKLFSEQNPDFDTEIFDAIVLLFKLIISQLEEKLQKLPTNNITGTTPVEDIVQRVGDITELFVSLIEGVLLNVASEQIKTDSDVEVLRTFLSANKLVVLETKRTLEEVVTNDQGTESILTVRDVFQVGTRIDDVIQRFESNPESGFQAWFRYNREALALLIGGLVSAYFGQTGATIASIITSILFDLIHTRVVEPKGVWCLMKSNKPEDMRNAVMTVVSDGLVGYAGGRFLETWIRSSEVDAIERVRAERTRLGLTTPLAKKNNREVWTEIRDPKTGKRYYGTNKKIRTILKLEEANPNLYVEKFKIEKDLPIKRKAETCAEMHAFHQMLEDRPDANVSKTPVCTFEILENGTYKNITRCKNCMTRELFMGNVPTDKLITDKNSLPQKGESREFYESYFPTPLWYCTEHTILTRAEYSKLIKQAILVYRQMQDKVDQK